MQLNRAQRLLLYGSTVFWLLSMVAAHQRNDQDAWILDGIFWPFVGFIGIFLLIVSQEKDNRVVALMCASTAVVVALIPGLKYQQPYGTTVDSTMHYLMVSNLASQGRVIGDSMYASIPGMHAWLASIALTGGTPVESLFRFQLPMIGGALPLLVYWLCKRVGLRAELSRVIILSSTIPIFPYHLLTGTGFTRTPFILLLGVLLLREYYCSEKASKFSYTLLALFCIFQLAIWHSTTPVILPVVLLAASLTPIVAWLINRDPIKISITIRFLQVALLSVVVFLAYRVTESDQIFTHMVNTLYRFVTTEGVPQILPNRFFEISLLDKLQIATVMHGQDFLLIGFSVLGVLLILRGKIVSNRHRPFFVYWLLICSVFVLLLPSIPILNFQRLAWVPLALSPFFIGPALWWLKENLLARKAKHSGLAKFTWFFLIAVLVGGSIVQFFLYQPLVPKASAISQELSDEYILWVNQANSAYQRNMLEFAERHTIAETRFATDYRARHQYTRYFGYEAAGRRRVNNPLLDGDKPIQGSRPLLLLHWPGPAGGLSEQVEHRSAAALIQLRQTIGWGLVYDNGESFILKVR